MRLPRQETRRDVTIAAPTGTRPGPSVALLCFVVLSLLMTWPLALRVSSHLPLGDNDLWQNYWNLWWWKTALLERFESPYATTLLYAPGETSLACHTHSEGNILVTLPVLATLGPAAALNVATLFAFILSGWGAYLLAAELLGDRRAAFLSGVVFAFFPQHFEQSLEHLNLISFGGMPLFLFALVRALRTDGIKWWLVTALFFALNALFSWHNGLLVVPGAAALFALELYRTAHSRGKLVLRAIQAGIAQALILLPFAWPKVSEMLQGETYFLKPAVHKPIDPVFLVVPAEHHPFWGGIVSPLYAAWRGYLSAGFTAYVGLVTLGLASIGVFSSRLPRRVAAEEPRPKARAASEFPRWFWCAWTGCYLLLSLGSELRFAGQDSGLPMPFGFVDEIPLFNTLRVANRFLVPAMLGLSLLAGWGASAWLSRLRRPSLWAALFVAITLLEFLWIPYPLRPLERPPWIEAMERAPQGAVLNIPGGHRARGAKDMYYQTLHGRPLVGGYVSCTPPRMDARLERYPILHLLFEGEKRLEKLPSVEHLMEGRERDFDALGKGLEEVLGDLEPSVVVVHLDRVYEDLKARKSAHRGRRDEKLYNPEKGMPRARLAAMRKALRELWGPPRYQDRDVELFWRGNEHGR